MEINRNNYEDFFLLYVDNELPAHERKAVEQFVLLHPDLREELNILRESVLVPAGDIIFENKEELFKKEGRRVVPFRWWRMAAAAVILFALGTFGWLYFNNESSKQASPVAEVKEIKEDTEDETVKQKAEQVVPQQNEITEPVLAKTEETATGPVVETRKPVVAKTSEPKRIITEPVEIAPEVLEAGPVAIEEPKEVIDVAVTPRKLDKEINEVAFNASSTEPQLEAKPEYVEVSDDNIYFANTAVSKRNKLRGVFRKASRILDKVTSLQ